MIVHLDADAFFASVEQAENPELRGKAMAVGGERRGIIASASYEARRCGVYTPMPSTQARKVCPHLIIVHGDFSKYRRYSRRMFSFAEEFTPHIECASIDEGYFDFGTNPRIQPRVAAARLQQRIAEELKITVSLGIAANKLVAQIASKLRKPNALVEVPRGTEREFLAPLESHWLPGVGPKLGIKLRSVGLRFVHQIAAAPLDFLTQVAGSYALQLQQFARGIDERPVVTDSGDAKSYGAQETFDENVTDVAAVVATLHGMADELMSKVRRDRKAMRTVTVKLRYADMSDVSHGFTFEAPTDLETDIYPVLPRLVREAWKRRASLRLVGLRFSNITEPAMQTELALDERAIRRTRQRRAAELLDEFRARSLPVMRGTALRSSEPENKT